MKFTPLPHFPNSERIKRYIKRNAFFYHFLVSAKGAVTGFLGILRNQKGAKEYLFSTASFFIRSSFISGMPSNATIEPTNICNLRCPVCETGAGILNREKRNMALEEFKIIADKIAPFTNTLMFYFMGEPFLNNDIYEMIKYAKKKRIPFVTTCSNGSFVNPVKLVESGIDEVSFQICGLTKDIHGIYRVDSDLDSVIINLKETIDARNASKSRMRITCGYILMKQNEHQLADFKKYMRQIGVDEAVVIDPCVRTLEQARKFLPSDKNHWIYDPVAFEQGKLEPKSTPKNSCPWIYYSITILADGSVVPCCRDASGNLIMGNILSRDIKKIWNGRHFREFRKEVMFKKSAVSICNLCSSFGIARLR